MSSSDEITLQQPDYTVQHEATPIGGRYYSRWTEPVPSPN